MTKERAAAIAARAAVLSTCVLALVAVGYALCFGVLWVCPAIVPSPELWMTATSTDDVFRLSIANLLYWMLALAAAIALAVLITLLAARTLRVLGELEPARQRSARSAPSGSSGTGSGTGSGVNR